MLDEQQKRNRDLHALSTDDPKRGWRWLRATHVLTAIVAIPLLISPAVAQTQDDVDDAVEAREEAAEDLAARRVDLQAAILDFQLLSGEAFELEDRVTRLRARVAVDGDEIAELRQSTQRLVLEAYVAGTESGVSVIFDSSSIGELATIGAFLDRANRLRAARLDRLVAVNREFDRLARMLDEDSEKLAAKQVETEATRDRLDDLFHAVEADYKAKEQKAEQAKQSLAAETRRLAEEARRRADEEKRALDAKNRNVGGGAVGGLVCPSSSPLSFINDWGFPRSGGRSHQGTDIFAAYGRPVFAVVSGVVSAREGGLGGITIWLNGDDGNAYYYAHLSGWAPNVATGGRVSRGDEIGYVGDSGNAKGTPPHTHFQIHPGGGRPINPYPTLARLCDR